MTTAPVYDPRGIVEAQPLAPAPRVAKLAGLRLGLLDNTKWNANKLLRGVRDRLAEKHGFSAHNFSYRLDGEGRVRRHSMVIRSSDRTSAERLYDALENTESVLEFRIAPTGD